jgi:hypothetical protein
VLATYDIHCESTSWKIDIYVLRINFLDSNTGGKEYSLPANFYSLLLQHPPPSEEEDAGTNEV